MNSSPFGVVVESVMAPMASIVDRVALFAAVLPIVGWLMVGMGASRSVEQLEQKSVAPVLMYHQV